jgi:hypothetical protein
MIAVNCLVLFNLSPSNSLLEFGFQTSALFVKITIIQNWALKVSYFNKQFLQNHNLSMRLGLALKKT